MAKIEIKDISVFELNGVDLFNESDSFMNEPSEDDRVEAI